MSATDLGQAQKRKDRRHGRISWQGALAGVCLIGLAVEAGWVFLMTWRLDSLWVPEYRVLLLTTGVLLCVALLFRQLVPRETYAALAVGAALYAVFAGLGGFVLPSERPFVGIRVTEPDGYILQDWIVHESCPEARQLQGRGVVRIGGGREMYIERKFASWRWALLLDKSPRGNPRCFPHFTVQNVGVRAWLFGPRVIGERLSDSLIRGATPLLLLIMLFEYRRPGELGQVCKPTNRVWMAVLLLAGVLLALGGSA